jgi:RNA polymerase-binding transcription factor DksA
LGTELPTEHGSHAQVRLDSDAVDADTARDLLNVERRRLEHVRDTFDGEHLHDESEDESSSTLSHVHQHPADVGSDTFEREKDLSILDQIEAEIADVERALARLDDGTYGTCQACGAVIGDDRLAAVPATRFCVDHQMELEKPRLDV